MVQSGSGPPQFAISHAVGALGRRAQALAPIRFIVAVIAGVPEDLAVILEGQDVGCHAVEKPTIVRDDQHRAGETFDRIFQGCLLYTSDAADDLLCVDLGGSRLINKKKTPHHRS